MEQINYEELWEKIEQHGTPCKIRLLSEYKKTYTGAGAEYVALRSIQNRYVPLEVEEVKRGKENVLWGRLKDGDGWIELKDVQFCE